MNRHRQLNGLTCLCGLLLAGAVVSTYMPQMGGKEMIAQMRPLLPKAKVLLVSGHTDDALTHHGVLEPGIAFLEKPFSPARLTFKVREVLDTEELVHI